MSIGPSSKKGHILDSKRISVSKKRQITIPQKFFDSLNIGEEVECIMTNSEIIIRPVKQETEFAEEILKDLIVQGFEGEQLLDEFRKTRSQIRPAIKRMIDEAELVANSLDGSEDDKMREIFSDVED